MGFAICLALAAQWKGTPLLLLGVLLAERKPNWRALAAGALWTWYLKDIGNREREAERMGTPVTAVAEMT
jgi:hypothetical protein